MAVRGSVWAPVLAAAAALSNAQVATGQEAEPRTEIVVTGRGLDDTPAVPAYRVTEIGRDQLTSSASGRIEDVLANVAGFQQFRRSDSRSSNPSAQGVTLRGIGGNATSRALVLLDGVPMADPFFGYIPLSAIAPERLSNVRVTHGGGSGAFGAGAVSGTIELTSAGPDSLDRFTGSAARGRPGRNRADSHRRTAPWQRLCGGERPMGSWPGLLHHARRPAGAAKHPRAVR